MLNRQTASWHSTLLWATPAAAVLAGWEIAGRRDPTTAFFVSCPSQVATELVTALAHGDLWLDAAFTLLPAAVGLFLGAAIGGGMGFLLAAYPDTAARLRGPINWLGSFPVFAIAPMTLLWFGIGLAGKVFLAFLGCVFVLLQAAYLGGLSVPPTLVSHMEAHRFSRREALLKVRLPFAMEWLTAAFRNAANLALLGVFVGEFIASEHGLARVMLSAGALYDVKRVLAAAVLFAAIGQMLAGFASLVHKYRTILLRWISVPPSTRKKGLSTWQQ